jgi:hypothetical protein
MISVYLKQEPIRKAYRLLLELIFGLSQELCCYSVLENNNNENDKYILLVGDDKDTVYTFDISLKSFGLKIFC